MIINTVHIVSFLVGKIINKNITTCVHSFSVYVTATVALRWWSRKSSMQSIVSIKSAETKPFTPLNTRYSLNNPGSW